MGEAQIIFLITFFQYGHVDLVYMCGFAFIFLM